MNRERHSWGRRLQRALVLYGIRFFRLRGSNERAARGFAAGVFLNFLPTFGLGGVIAALLAHFIRANAAAAFLGGFSLAFMWPVLFFLNIQTGALFIAPEVPLRDLADAYSAGGQALLWGKTFLIGSVINGVATSVATYFLFLALYRKIQVPALQRLRAVARRVR